MSDLSALRGPLSILGVTALALAVLAVLIAQGQTTFLVPPPEQAVEQLLKGLKAHNYSAARDHLAEDLKQAVPEAELQSLNEAIEQAAGGIEDANGQDAQQQAQTATAQVQVKLKDGSEHDLSLPLQQENGLWKVSSLESIRALTNP